MKAMLSVLLFALAGLSLAGETPKKLALRDGRALEGVTSAEMDGDKLRVAHSGGISRIGVGTLTPESQKALGMVATDEGTAAVQNLKRVETVDGKVFDGVSKLKVTPSGISFVHSGGAATVRFDQLPETIRQQAGYDPAKAAAYDRKKADEANALLLVWAKEDAAARKTALSKNNSQIDSAYAREYLNLLRAYPRYPYYYSSGFNMLDYQLERCAILNQANRDGW
jgi:hypothetical protein